MATLASLKADLNTRLNDAANTIWPDAEKVLFVSDAVGSLFPNFFKAKTGTSTASAGPVQTGPTGVINIHYIGVQSASATRVRVIRGWSEGYGDAIVPKVNILGQTLVWGWSEAYAVPASTSTALEVPAPGLEVARLRAEISAFEQVLGSRTKTQKYLAVQVREGVSESEMVAHLDALHASVESRLKLQPPLPTRVG